MKLLGIAMLVVVLSATASVSSSRGQYCTGYYARSGQQCGSAYCDNTVWPSYYIPAARNSVNSAYTAMISNGWRRQNLLGAYHFDSETSQLTAAGKLKAQWVLTQAPQDRRNIFVERGSNQAVTDSRIAAVNDWVASQSSSDLLGVSETHIVAEGHQAGSVDSIFVGFQANQPAPVLKADTGSSSSSSGN